MRISEELLVLANWLESSENETLVRADKNIECLDKVAAALVKAASILKEAADEVATVEPIDDGLTVEKLDEIASVAEAFSKSDDELLIRQASVLDELLYTLAAPKNAILKAKQAEDDRINELKKKYQDVKKSLDESNKVSEALKDIEASPMYKEYSNQGLDFMSHRTCPDHPGVSLQKLSDNFWRCEVDGKRISWDEGFSTAKGNKIPGRTVDMQTDLDGQSYSAFNNTDTRTSRMGTGNL